LSTHVHLDDSMFGQTGWKIIKEKGPASKRERVQCFGLAGNDRALNCNLDHVLFTINRTQADSENAFPTEFV